MSESDKKINIDYVAQLARLELSDEDKAKLSGQLNDILVYFEKLNSVNVDGIKPMAPESREDQVVVPKVVE